MSTGSGDKLARGFHSATFPPAGGEVSQKKWDDIFRDFDPEKYKNVKKEPKTK